MPTSAPLASPHKTARSFSLGTKLASATVFVLAVVAAALFFGIREHERASVFAAKETAGLMVARLFAANASAPLTFGDEKGVGESVAMLATNEDVGYGAAWAVEDGKLGAQLGELRRSSADFAPPTAVPVTLTASRSAEWVVVDGPVSDPTGKVVGVARVAFSLAKENAALAAMERKVLLASVGTSLALALVLVILSRMLIVRPLSRLAGAAHRLEAGERVEVHAESGDEVGQLAAAFSTMSNAIAAREQRIAERNRDMRLVLDNVEDGFLSVDRDGKMSDERSRIVDEWFGAPAAGATLFEYLEQIAPKAAQWLRLGWETILEDVFPLDMAIDQLPKRFLYAERHFELRYRPLLDGERLTGMLVVVSDVTMRVEHERADAGQREMLAIFRRMLADRHAFAEFMTECGALVEAITAGEGADTTALARQLHTLKGNTSLFGVESVAKVCHELESRMLEVDERPSSEELEAVKVLWNALLARCSELGWSTHMSVVQLETTDLRELLDAVRAGADHRAIATIVGSWSLEPASARLARIGEQIERLSPRLSKPVPAIEIVPTKLRLPTKKWAPLLTSLAHIVRNVVDHGLETEEERLAAGKSLPARVRLSLAKDPSGSVVLEIGDDGRGIDWDRIAARAKVAGLPHGTKAELEAALFADGVSSREEVSQTSGRGVGMGAVLAATHACGGTLTVESTRGEGTKFRFVLPAALLVSDEPPLRSLLPPARSAEVPS